MSAQPSTLRQLPVPDTEPDPEHGPLTTSRWTAQARPRSTDGVQGVLTLVVGGYAEEDDFGPVPTASSDLPDPQRWARQLVQVIAEVVTGHRPHTQLLRWTDASVHTQIRALTLPRARPGRPPRRRARVGTVRVCQPADGVAEVSAVVHGQYRTQALALRLEGLDGRWRVTALETG